MPQQTMTTSGYFRPGLFRFLKDLKTHNERAWFQANKQRYEADVQEPFLRLIADLSPTLKKIGGGFIADPSPKGGSMMRIYRDIRFSKDKSPYKTYAAAHFWQAKGKDGAAPAYFLHLEPGNSVIGGGIWQPEPKALKKIRDKIAGDPKAWGRATTGGALGSTCRMAGESLKRPPAGYDPAHPFIDDIKRKDFAISTPLTDQEVTGDDFLDLVLQRLRATAPFVQFLSNAVGLS
jgi:uncharacterized protein (TIGR02453 family)